MYKLDLGSTIPGWVTAHAHGWGGGGLQPSQVHHVRSSAQEHV